MIQLTKSTSAYEVKRLSPQAGLVVIQEIFGVNSHIREVSDSYSLEGFHVLAPQLFDPIKKSVELSYDQSSVKIGRALTEELGWNQALQQVQTAIDHLKDLYTEVYVMGYCWGGSLAYLSACQLNGIKKAVCYYGRQIPDFLNEKPKCPVLFHFGESDPLIPMERVELVKRSLPEQLVFTYSAGHGFNCDHRSDYNAEAAVLAKKRTLQFLKGSIVE